MKLRLAGATAFFIASLLNPEASGKNGSRPNPTPTPTQSGPSAPALVAPANAASVVQPMTLDWNPVSVSGGPIGSYTWQVGTSSTFGTTGAASYTLQISDQTSFSPLIVNQTLTASQFSSSTLPIKTMWWRVRANDASGKAGNWSAARRFEVKN